MSEQTCPKCGRPLNEGELCPNCLLNLAVSPPTQLVADLSGVVHVTSDWDLNVQGSESSPPEMPDIEAVRAAFPQLEIIEAAGQGGMGAVFKARQPKLDRFVALKILPSNLESKPGFTERFHQEGKLLAKLSHPNIVAVHDVGESGGFYYLLMEYVDGVNLRQAIKNHSFTPEQAIAMVPKICDALQYAHDEGVLHRDIKPANILLDTKGRVKIADFGIAKLMRVDGDTMGNREVGNRPPGDCVDDEQVGHRPLGGAVGDSRLNGEPDASAEYRTLLPGGQQPTDLALTLPGQILGTPSYMAPEQLHDPDHVDHRADIYSLGVVFYELLTGELPKGSFPVPSEITPVSADIDHVVMKAMDKEREKRQQSAEEMKSEITAAAWMNGRQQTADGSRDDHLAGPHLAGTPGNRAGCWGCSLLALAFVMFCAMTIFWLTPARQMSVSISSSGDVVKINGQEVDMTPEEAEQHLAQPAVVGGFIALFFVGTMFLCVCLGLWLIILQIYRWVTVGNRTNTVIPAKAGIQTNDLNPGSLAPRLRGGDGKDVSVPPTRMSFWILLILFGIFVVVPLLLVAFGTVQYIRFNNMNESRTREKLNDFIAGLPQTQTQPPIRTITLAEFDAIKAKYADLQLGEFNEYNIIELGSTEETDGVKYFDFTEQGLRDAIATAGNTTESDLIVIHTTAEQNTILLDGNGLIVDIDAQQFGGITIVSFGEENLTIDGNAQFLIFRVRANTGAALGGLTLTNARTSASVSGGAIRNDGTLNVTECIIRNNLSGGYAGVVLNIGTMFLTKSEISDNDSLAWGGGITNSGTLTAAHCTIANNRTPSGSGAGILTRNNSTLALTACTIAGNSVGGKFNGGGLFGQHAKVTITNCLIVGNVTNNGGGAMALWGGHVTITNSTIVGNKGYQHVGGIALWDGATATINNSIVTYNSDRNIGFDMDQDVPSDDLSGSNNFFEQGSGQTSLSNGEDGNIIGTIAQPIDPQFINFTLGGNWRDWDLRLKAGSPAKEAGMGYEGGD